MKWDKEFGMKPMKVSGAVKAKYVFDQLTLGDVLELVKDKVGVMIVHQDDLTWQHIHFYWSRESSGKLNIYDGDENNDNEVSLWDFSLKEKVKVKGNMVYFKKEALARHGTAIELLKTSNIDVTKMLQKV